MNIKWGSLVVDGRGKIGGQFASRSRAGSFLATNSYSNAKRQRTYLANRPLFGEAAKSWRVLSETNRQGWEQYAAGLTWTNDFGDSYVPSAIAVYTAYVFRRLFYFQDQGQAPPSVRPSDSITNLEGKMPAPGFPAIQYGYNGSSPYVLVAFCTAPMKTPVKSELRRATYLLQTANVVPTGTLTLSGYGQKYPWFQVGDYVGVRIFLVNDQGWKSNELEAVIQMN